MRRKSMAGGGNKKKEKEKEKTVAFSDDIAAPEEASEPVGWLEAEVAGIGWKRVGQLLCFS